MHKPRLPLVKGAETQSGEQPTEMSPAELDLYQCRRNGEILKQLFEIRKSHLCLRTLDSQPLFTHYFLRQYSVDLASTNPLLCELLHSFASVLSRARLQALSTLKVISTTRPTKISMTTVATIISMSVKALRACRLDF